MIVSKNGDKKRPGQKATPPAGKAPRGDIVSSDAELISWHLGIIDREGPFGWSRMLGDDFWTMISARLRSFETMTWATLRSTGSHPVGVDDIIAEARRRLEEIGQDDVDELYSLRLGGKPRIWGVRDRHILKVLWWDPEHQVCPSHKKHT